jgi:hypothetical protein
MRSKRAAKNSSMHARRFTLIAAFLTLGLAPGLARAEEPVPQARPPAEIPTTAFAALVRAEAAYEYGDMFQVVEATRPVAEGTLPSTNVQRARALRFLGIGLFLTNRTLGAENAFAELLRVDASARLDPTTTRPEVVAFFENIRHQHFTREQSSRRFIWNFIPPVGQFQNGDKTKAWILGAVEFASLATLVTCRLVLYSWLNPNSSYGPNGSRNDDADFLKWRVAPASLGVLGAAYLYGVIDGIVRYYSAPDEAPSPLTLLIFPGGGGLRLTF